MTKDENKKIETITYNHLNLPKIITFEDGNSITYTYDAAGVKLKKEVYHEQQTTKTTYLGGYQYLDGVLQFFPTAEGYVEPTETGGYQYVYNYTDHLGNIRLSYTFDTTTSSLQIREENNYYPFGLKQKGYNNETVNSEYKYKYNGKELQDELGLNVYNYGARNYDAAIGRFFNMDRLSEKYKELTPFHYTANNPVYFVDVKGDSINVADLYRKDKKGEYVNKSRVEAFEFFANTKEGKIFLSQFASKGQIIAGVTFEADGKFHEAGVDLNYDTDMSKYNQHANGETGAEMDDNGRLQISVSLQTNTMYDMVETITHESFIHAERDAIDFVDNGKMDSSNIDSDIKGKNREASWQHIQERRDTKKQRSYFWRNGYPLLIRARNKYNKSKTNESLYLDMYDFSD